MSDWHGGPAVTVAPTTPRGHRVLRYHVAEVMRLLAEAEFIVSGPWSRECPDCGAAPRRPCMPDCLRFQ